MMSLENEAKGCCVGLISDTHGYFDDSVVEILSRADDLIVHSGDVGDKRYKSRLTANSLIEKLRFKTEKEVMAVSGNSDVVASNLPHELCFNILEKKVLVMHVCGYPGTQETTATEKITTFNPDIVVFGHSHVPGFQWHNKVLYINPGSAGPKRFKLPRTVALLHISDEIRVEFFSLPSGTRFNFRSSNPPTNIQNKSKKRGLEGT